MSAATGPATGPAGPTPAVPATSVSPAAKTAAPAMTLADRWDLLTHWRGPIAKSLKYRLLANDAAGFDRMLLDYMVQRTGTYYYFQTADVPDYLRFIRLRASRHRMNLSAADAALAHRFPEQTSAAGKPVQLPHGEIDWDAQPATTTNPEFLHVLNRHAFWRDLAIAYRATDDTKYSDELVAQLTSWSRQDPPLADPGTWPSSGPHWWLYDAANRADNWTRTYMLMLGSPAWTPEVNTLFLRGIYQHGDLLFRAPPDKVTSNKAAAEAVGLLKIAVAFPEFAAAPDWEAHANDLMFRCLDAQFYPDGTHVEESPGYQANAMLGFVDAFLLQKQTGRGDAWSRRRRLRLQNTLTAMLRLRSPDGSTPALSDTTRNFISGQTFVRAAVVLGALPPMKPYLGDEEVWLFGPDRVTAIESGPWQFWPDGARPEGIAFPDAGYYVMSGGHSQMIFDAGPKGGSHGHLDLLSFEWSSNSRQLVADPGSYLYDGSADRQWAISTPAHNTISVDGLSHAAVEGAHNPAIVVDDFQLAADHDQITAHHHAYEYLKGRPVVGRTVWLDRRDDQHPVALLIDWAHAAATHTFTTSLTLPGASASKVYGGGRIDNPHIWYADQWDVMTRVQSLPVAGQTFAREARFVSNHSTDRSPATRYAVSQRGRDAVFATLIYDHQYGARDDVTAAWETPPVPGKTLQIRLTYRDGTSRLLSFTPPSLATLDTPAVAASVSVPVAPRATPPAAPVRAAATAGVFATAPASTSDWLRTANAT